MLSKGRGSLSGLRMQRIIPGLPYVKLDVQPGHTGTAWGTGGKSKP